MAIFQNDKTVFSHNPKDGGGAGQKKDGENSACHGIQLCLMKNIKKQMLRIKNSPDSLGTLAFRSTRLSTKDASMPLEARSIFP